MEIGRRIGGVPGNYSAVKLAACQEMCPESVRRPTFVSRVIVRGCKITFFIDDKGRPGAMVDLQVEFHAERKHLPGIR